MSDNVVDFSKKNGTPILTSREVISLHISQDNEGYYEVYAEVAEDITDYEAYIAMEAAISKFALDTGLIELDD